MFIFEQFYDFQCTGPSGKEQERLDNIHYLNRDTRALVQKIKSNNATEKDVVACYSKRVDEPFKSSQLIGVIFKLAALFYSSSENIAIILKFLISDRKARGVPLGINKRYDCRSGNDLHDNGSALHYLASTSSYIGSCELAEILISNGADVNAQNGHGNTPLHLVQLTGPYYRNSINLNFIQILLLHGANPLIPNSSMQTPLSIANFSKIDFFRGNSTNNAILSLLDNAAKYGKMLLLPLIFYSSMLFATPSCTQATKENQKNMEYFSNLRKNKPCFKDFVSVNRLCQKANNKLDAHLPRKLRPAILH